MKTSLKNQHHPLAVGDFTKYQDLLKEHGLFGNIKGLEPTIEEVETKDVNPIEAQRDTEISWAYNKIKQRNGLDLSVMTPIKLIRVNGKLYCYDGLGKGKIIYKI